MSYDGDQLCHKGYAKNAFALYHNLPDEIDKAQAIPRMEIRVFIQKVNFGHVDILHGDFALKIDGWTK